MLQTFEFVGERDEHVATEAGLDHTHHFGAERLDLNHTGVAFTLIEDACNVWVSRVMNLRLQGARDDGCLHVRAEVKGEAVVAMIMT